MRLGAAYLIAEFDGPGHLWIVCSNASDARGAALFSVTTTRAHTRDHSCPLRVGDHPFIQHDSVIAYQLGKCLTLDGFNGLREMGMAQERPAVSEAVLRRIQRGALDSAFTPDKLKALVRATMDANR